MSTVLATASTNVAVTWTCVDPALSPTCVGSTDSVIPVGSRSSSVMVSLAGETGRSPAEPKTRAVSSPSAMASSTGVRASVLIPLESPARMVSFTAPATKSLAVAAVVVLPSPPSSGNAAPSTNTDTSVSTGSGEPPVSSAVIVNWVSPASSPTSSGAT